MSERAYLDARDAAWARFHDVTNAAAWSHQNGETSASEYLVARDAALAELDDTMTAARKAAGYQR